VDLTSGDDTPPDSIDMLDVVWCVQAVFGTGVTYLGKGQDGLQGDTCERMAGACESQSQHERSQHIDTGPVEELKAGLFSALEECEDLVGEHGGSDDPRAAAELDPGVLGDHAIDATWMPPSTPGVLDHQPVRMAWNGLNGLMRIPETGDGEQDLFDGHVIAVRGNEGSDAATCECWWHSWLRVLETRV
jgi:hypothetical protein